MKNKRNIHKMHKKIHSSTANIIRKDEGPKGNAKGGDKKYYAV